MKQQQCCIGPEGHPQMHRMHGRPMGMAHCGCHGHGRLFFTKQERIEKLNKYKNHLEQELKGVSEAIAALEESASQ